MPSPETVDAAGALARKAGWLAACFYGALRLIRSAVRSFDARSESQTREWGAVLEAGKQLREEVRKENDDLREQNRALVLENEELRRKIIRLESSGSGVPKLEVETPPEPLPRGGLRR